LARRGNALVNLAYHGARAEKPDFRIALQRDPDPPAGTADVYPQEVTRVLLNLISNGFYAATQRKKEAGEGLPADAHRRSAEPGSIQGCGPRNNAAPLRAASHPGNAPRGTGAIE
jgi:hypothetical protein